MAAPTAPTLVTITTEGLKKAGYASPSATQLTRAQGEFVEEIKADIWTACKRLRSLMESKPIKLTKGQVEYAFPSDFSAILSATLLHGVNTGTAQNGAVGTVTLAAAEDVTDDFAIGKDIWIKAGTGLQQITQIIAYNETTKVATVEPDFTTAPGVTSEYMIVDEKHPLDVTPVSQAPYMTYPENRKPVGIYPIGDDTYDSFLVYPPPDDEYGLLLRYYVDLQRVDLASNLMVKLYRRWRNIFTYGVKYKQLEYDDDDRQANARAEYDGYLKAMIARERYGMTDFSMLQARVVE